MPSSSIKHSLYGPLMWSKIFWSSMLPPGPVKNSAFLDCRDTNIERLVNWFDPVLRAVRCQVQDVINQWHSLKITVNTQFHNKDYCSLQRMLLTKDPYKTDLKDTLHLVEILLVLPAISDAGCKRMFSAQNRIKSSRRASFKTLTPERLILISAQGQH